MGRFFNMDNKFFTIMSRVADLVMLNIVFIICCIPIVTIGASVTAMNYVTLKMSRNEESYIIRGFFKSFKENFKQATVIWLLMLVAAIIFVVDLLIVRQVDGGFIKVISYILYVVMLIYAMVITYIFPLLAKFENTIKNTFRNALLMSIRHLPWTLLLLIITFVPSILIQINTLVMAYGIMAFILIGFSLTALVNAYIFVRIFDKYIPAEEEPSLDSSAETIADISQ